MPFLGVLDMMNHTHPPLGFEEKGGRKTRDFHQKQNNVIVVAVAGGGGGGGGGGCIVVVVGAVSLDVIGASVC